MRCYDMLGTPVCVCGGELAQTLLGVDFNDQTGAVSAPPTPLTDRTRRTPTCARPSP
jgi:hypothetical protein